tara:strand:- start:469 stop:792 length:324 start_codon:yes stop_codon:yes gene_type:complete
MTRVGFQFKVKEDSIYEYRLHHKNVWPEMLNALKKHGWNNYSLFMRPDGLIFGYFETHGTFEEALTGMGTEAVNRKWQTLMAPFFEGEDLISPDQLIVQLEEVFYTN